MPKQNRSCFAYKEEQSELIFKNLGALKFREVMWYFRGNPMYELIKIRDFT